MSETTHGHGFRIVGPCHGKRRRATPSTVFRAYCQCDPKAGVDREAYLSAFQFGDDFAKLLDRTGSPAGFAGSTWASYLWADIDRDDTTGGIGRGLADLRLLVDTLVETFGVPREVLLPFFSGSKGFHLGIPTGLWLPAAAPDFHEIAREFMEQLAAEAKIEIDAGIYDRVRALRAPNSRHPKTGLHKSFLPVDLLDALSVDDVLACSQRPEPFEPPSLDGIESGDFLVADWDRAALAVAAKTAAIEQRLHGHADGERKGTVNQLTRSFLAGAVTVGNRHRLLFSAAANLAELGCPLPAIHALLSVPALNSGLPPKDVDRQIECGYARGAS